MTSLPAHFPGCWVGAVLCLPSYGGCTVRPFQAESVPKAPTDFMSWSGIAVTAPRGHFLAGAGGGWGVGVFSERGWVFIVAAELTRSGAFLGLVAVPPGCGVLSDFCLSLLPTAGGGR